MNQCVDFMYICVSVCLCVQDLHSKLQQALGEKHQLADQISRAAEAHARLVCTSSVTFSPLFSCLLMLICVCVCVYASTDEVCRCSGCQSNPPRRQYVCCLPPVTLYCFVCYCACCCPADMYRVSCITEFYFLCVCIGAHHMQRLEARAWPLSAKSKNSRYTLCVRSNVRLFH